jgi:hypothetical protein
MIIRDAFKKNIGRPINGVVKADQLDEASVWQELEEYVLTAELDGHLRAFMGAYLATVDNARDPATSSRTGVWISGFFGSGKSHFLKILGYLLENKPANHDGQAKTPIQFFQDKISDPIYFADIKRAAQSGIEVILFNIDSKASRNDEDPILSVFLRVFNEKLGYDSDHPHIARLERELESRGKLSVFHAKFQALARASWTDSRDAYDFLQDEMVQAIAETLGQSVESARKIVQYAQDNATLTPESFAKLVKEYLDQKGPDHRLMFLIDEVGQFVGEETQLMLRLQTITENLGTACMGRAWVVVTSQENIDAVIGEVKASRANDFSKIQGRFKTRLSLSSSNTDEVIRIRLLDKTREAEAELKQLFDDNGYVLRNQLSFRGNKRDYRNVKDATEFAANYPFLPYQFVLLQRVFEEIRKHGATGLHLSRGERSLLDAFQDAAKTVSDNEVGILVPLYLFYPSIESFLDTQVKRTIEQAAENPKLEPFDIQVLRVLFLIRYVEEFKGNTDNLTTLCLDQIDADRLALKRGIEESLVRLEGQNFISRNGDEYSFLTNEEQDINREIKNVDLGSGEETKKLGEFIFGGVIKEPFTHRHPVNKKPYGYNRYVDGVPTSNPSQSNDLEVRIITPLNDEYGFWNQAKCVAQSTDCLIAKLDESKELGRELRLYLQTEKFIRRKNDGSQPPTIKRILSDRAEENRQREHRVATMLDDLLKTADYYVAGQTRQSEGASLAVILGNHLNYLIENLFPKMGYLGKLQKDDESARTEARNVLISNAVGQESLALKTDDPNFNAIEDLRNFIKLSSDSNRKIVLKELVAKFEGKPWGWPQWEIVLILCRLLVLGEITLVADIGNVAPNKAWEYLSKTQQWGKVQIHRRKVVEAADIQKARKIGNDVFGKMGPEKESDLDKFLRDFLKQWQSDLRSYAGLADSGRYPGMAAIDAALKTIAAQLLPSDTFAFIEEFIRSESKLLDLKDEQIYRLLLLGQCRSLNQAMPFLFESIDDATELLLPDNLLATDSIVRKISTEIEERAWSQIEIIGWLYQFYIIERKDLAIGTVVRTEDIPAATQFFTPNWIVKYLLQNSLGRLWLNISPESELRGSMKYLVEPAVQDAQVQAQLDSLASEQRERHKTPMSIRLLDPCVGSGHILVEAYDLFRTIYEERGYAKREIARLILENNLFGFEVDERAAQIAGFALMMRARADDRMIFSSPPRLGILTIKSSEGLSPDLIASSISSTGNLRHDLESEPVFSPISLIPELDIHPTLVATRPRTIPNQQFVQQAESLVETFADAKTLGSLILITDIQEHESLAHATSLSEQTARGFGIWDDVQELILQSRLLASQYDITVTNPPYLSNAGMNPTLKEFASLRYPRSKSDLFSMFIERCCSLTRPDGFVALVTMQVWLTLKTYGDLRKEILEQRTIDTLVQIGYNSFPELNSKIAQACMFVLRNQRIAQLKGTYINLNSAPQSADKNEVFLNRGPETVFEQIQLTFASIPGSPIAYSASERVLELFVQHQSVSDFLVTREGLTTGSNARFVRFWWEVSLTNIGFGISSADDANSSGKRWFPYQKGGDFRRWSGNRELVVDWYKDGINLKTFVDPSNGRVRSHNYNGDYAFKRGITWTSVTSGTPAFRFVEGGFKFDAGGSMAFGDPSNLLPLLAVLNSDVTVKLLSLLSPTINLKQGSINALPVSRNILESLAIDAASRLVQLHNCDWNEYESSWEFETLVPSLSSEVDAESWWLKRACHCSKVFSEALELEKRNNRSVAEAYGLSEELSIDVDSNTISLWANPQHVFRRKRKDSAEDDQPIGAKKDTETGENADPGVLEAMFRQKGIVELVSYSLGCMMGRYNSTEPDIAYAASAGEGFDPNAYDALVPDDDGIIPVLEDDWFPAQDAANRFSEFVNVVWPKDQAGGVSLDDNLRFVAESIGYDASTQPLQSIRTYFATQFYKDHLSTYKNRPIYWLFSSGRERGFQALVYLHRYNGGTLSRMRMDYVVPLQQRMSARLEQLEGDIEASATTSDRKRREKEREKLKKQIAELRIYDEKLRHYADQRIELDLDDGVKANYAKFGDLLAESKAITGDKEE